MKTIKPKSEFYSEIYFVDNSEHLTEKQWDNLLMVGNKNWDKYFIPFKTKREYEIIKNVKLTEFELKDDMFKYIKRLNSHSVLNFSLEHEKPFLLELI
ncbi:MAG: hypothetical protein KAI57_01890 [Candidatus Pacebacteria bacterium]|nr:hypothetical protein [Candidatus Paceibacterota bacterium]